MKYIENVKEVMIIYACAYNFKNKCSLFSFSMKMFTVVCCKHLQISEVKVCVAFTTRNKNMPKAQRKMCFYSLHLAILRRYKSVRMLAVDLDRFCINFRFKCYRM
jgi:hypothetical protein